MSSGFFLRRKKIYINDIFKKIKIKKNFIIKDIKPLYLSKKNDLTFFDSIKYKSDAILCKASACITTNKLSSYLPAKTEKIIVDITEYPKNGRASK